MDKCSYFIKNKAIFGSHPKQEEVDVLEKKGVRYFVDLTHENEKNIVVPYTTQYTYIKYSIPDHNIPQDFRSFNRFIIKISKIIKNLKTITVSEDKQISEILYIHCRGGHGRSGVVVASILCHIFNIDTDDSLELTTMYHNNRVVMKDKWRKIGSPQTINQKFFVKKIFEPIYFYHNYSSGISSGFSNFSHHSVYIEKIGLFPTAEAAFQAHKNIDDEEYVHKQLNSRSPSISKNLGRTVQLSPKWNDIQLEIMEMILKLKLEQHPEIKQNLLSTGLRPIIEYKRNNSFWSDKNCSSSKNIVGKLLMKIRNEFYENELE
jgi:ribA/ribD-fused uncharacterized protein